MLSIPKVASWIVRLWAIFSVVGAVALAITRYEAVVAVSKDTKQRLLEMSSLSIFGWAVLFGGFVCLAYVMYADGFVAKITQLTALLKGQNESPTVTDAAPGKIRPFSRDVSVSEAITFLESGTWGQPFQAVALSPGVRIELAQKNFHQAAADGAIPVWGRPDKNRVHEPLGKEFWLKNRVGWFSLLKDAPCTEPLLSWDTSQRQFIDVMTSRVAIEGLAPSPEFRRAKEIVRRFSDLRDEGAEIRNRLLPVSSSFDAEKAKSELVEWDARVVAALEESDVRERERARFKTLDLFKPLIVGEEGRPDAQAHLEAMWNEKLLILKSIMDDVE